MNLTFNFFVFVSLLIASCFFTKSLYGGEFVNYYGPKSEVLAYEAMEKYGYEQEKKTTYY